MMPTRYTLDVDLKSIATSEALENTTKKTEARKVCASFTRMCLCAAVVGSVRVGVQG
jgi:hypothetical protein